MANGDFFAAFLRNASNYNGGEPEVYEDTHDASGNYTGRSLFGATAPQQQVPPMFAQPTQPYAAQQPPLYTPPPQASTAQARAESSMARPPQFANVMPQQAGVPQSIPLPTLDQYVSPQLNQNFVIYRPRTTRDVEQLIAYLRRREPALVDLDPIADSPDAQRLMDFTSGAAYALGDRVMAIRRNLFLITPDTIDVLKPDGE